MWGLEEAWKDNDIIQERFCKKVLRIPRFAANGIAELEEGGDSKCGWLFRID
jgi:hypothetical protein